MEDREHARPLFQRPMERSIGIERSALIGMQHRRLLLREDASLLLQLNSNQVQLLINTRQISPIHIAGVEGSNLRTVHFVHAAERAEYTIYLIMGQWTGGM